MIPNDADIEMMELRQAGNDIAKGICPICEDVLNPCDPCWAGEVWPPTYSIVDNREVRRPTTSAEYAACVGPESLDVPGYHERCLTQG